MANNTRKIQVGDAWITDQATKRVTGIALNGINDSTSIATLALDSSGNVVGLVGPGGYAVPQLQFTQGQLKKWRVALAKVQTKAANAKIAIIGDSCDTGYNTATANSWTGGKAFSTSDLLARVLNGMGIPVGIGSSFGSAFATNFATFLLYDPRWTATNMGIHGLATATCGGQPLAPAGAGAWTFNFTPTDTTGAALSYDTAELYYMQNTTYSSFSMSLDGVGAVSTLSSGTGALAKLTITGTLAAHVVNLSGTATALNDGHVLGVNCYNSAVKQVFIQNWSFSGATAAGATAASWSNNTQYYSCINGITFMAPDLSIIKLGLNDITAAYSVATFTAGLQTLITACLATGSVILVVPNVSTTSDVAPYISSIYQLAATNNVPIVDIYNRWTSYAQAQADGFMNSDPIHPNKTGYQDVVNAYYQFVLPRY